MEVVIDGDSSGVQSAVATAKSSLGTLGAATAAAAGAIGAVGTAVAGLSAKMAADFHESMQESIAVMGDVSATMRDELAGAAREVARTTVHSHEAAAESFYFLASAGLTAKESIAALPLVADFASAGALEMADATDYATDVAQAFGIEAENLARVTDALTGTFTQHNQTARGMGEAMSYVAPIASGLGITLEETATAIGIMGDAGIKGTKAGTSLRMALARLSKPPAAAASVLDRLGVSVRDSSGQMRSMADIIRDLNKAGATTADVMEIFGVRAGPAMQVLLDQGGDALDQQTKKLLEMKGITKEVADTQAQTFNKQLKITKDRIKDVGITIGDALLPSLSGMLKRMNPVIDAVGRFVSGLSDAQIRMASFASTGLTIVGILGMINPALGAVAAAVVGLAAAWKSNLGGIRDATQRVMGAAETQIRRIQIALGDFIPILRDVARTFGLTGSNMNRALRPVVQFLQGQAITAIESFGRATVAVLDAATSWWILHKNDVKAAVASVRATVATAMAKVRGVIQTVRPVLNRVTDAFGGWRNVALALTPVLFALLSPLGLLSGAAGIGGVASAATGLTGVLGTLGTFVLTVGTRLGGLAHKAALFLTSATRLKGALMGGLRVAFQTIARLGLFLGNALSTAVAVVRGIGPAVRGAFAALTNFRGILVGLRGLLPVLTMGLRGVGAAVLGLTGPVGIAIGLAFALYAAWNNNFLGIRDTVSQVLNAVKALLRGDTSKMRGIIQAGVQKMRAVWKNTLQPMIQDAIVAFNRVKAVVKNALTWVWKNAVVPILNSIRQHWQTHGQEIYQELVATWNAVMGYIKPVLKVLLGALVLFTREATKFWNQWGDEILAVTKFIFDVVGSVLNTAIDAIISLIRFGMAVVRQDWEGAWNIIAGFTERLLGGIWNFVKKWTSGFLGYIDRSLIQPFIGFFEDLYRDLIGGSLIPDMFTDIANYVKTTARKLLERAVTAVIDAVKRVFEAYRDWLIGGGGFIISLFQRLRGWVATTGASWASNAFTTVWRSIESVFQKGKDWALGVIDSLVSGLKDELNSAISWMKSTFNSAVPASISIPSVSIGGGTIPGTDEKIPSATVGGQTVNLPQLDAGGKILGSGLAMVHEGERVLTPAETKQVESTDGGDTYNMDIRVHANSREEGREAADGLSSGLRSAGFEPN